MTTSLKTCIVVVLLIAWLGGLPTTAGSADRRLDSSNLQQPKQSVPDDDDPAPNRDGHIQDEQLHEKRISQAMSNRLQHASDTENGDNAADNDSDRSGNLNEKSSSNENEKQSSSSDHDAKKEQQPDEPDSNLKSPSLSNNNIKPHQSQEHEPLKSSDRKPSGSNKDQSQQHKTPDDQSPKPDRHQPPKKQPQQTVSKSKDRIKEGNHDGNDHQVTKIKSKSKTALISKLTKAGDCDRDIKRFCASKKKNILSLLICLQTEPRRVGASLSTKCQTTLWNYKLTLTEDRNFDYAINATCRTALTKTHCDQYNEEKGNMISCLLRNQRIINNEICLHLLLRLRMIIFTNYKFIKPLFKACRQDIIKQQCGSLEVVDTNGAVSKGAVIRCLQNKARQLSSSCRQSIFNVSESQAEDFRLDRQLYSACMEDKDKLCRNVPPGKGQVYRCLIRHQDDPLMSEGCKAQLRRRENLALLDYKVLYGFATSCRHDISLHRCHVHLRREDATVNNEVTARKAVGIGRVLNCLANATSHGFKLQSQCRPRMLTIQHILFSKLKLTSSLVQYCGNSIQSGCTGKPLSDKENVLTCLMKLAPKGKLSSECLREIKGLVKYTNLVGNYRVSDDMFAACQPIANVLCKDITNYSKRLSCLMGNKNSDVMTAECRDHLHYILFFISRDMRVDGRLYATCKKDALQCGHAGNSRMDRLVSSMTFSCLYKRILDPTKSKSVSRNCKSLIERIMIQRGDDVDLHPEIQAACVPDLAKFCLTSVKHGQEIKCLQQNLKKLSNKCRISIGNFTVLESEDIRLNENLYRVCMSGIRQFCQDVPKKRGSILQCLIKNKNRFGITRECRNEIEDFQQIRTKDIRFSVNLKANCKIEIIKNCGSAKTRNDLLTCLANLYMDSKSDKRKVSERCQEQLRFEFRQQSEDIRLDPELYHHCKMDVKKLCNSVSYGNSQVIECLRKSESLLSNPCRELLHKREVLDIKQPGFDYYLMTNCRDAINKLCSQDRNHRSLLDCLIDHLSDQSINSNNRCKAAIKRRQVVSYKDYSLIPQLKDMCNMDVSKLCKKSSRSKGVAPILKCLKLHLLKNRLSKDCSAAIRHLEELQAREFDLDANLYAMCKHAASIVCPDAQSSEVSDCLKTNFKLIRDRNCSLEIIRIVSEDVEDIKTDPSLHAACRGDITKYCTKDYEISSDVFKCLWRVQKKLSLGCKNKMEKKSKQMKMIQETVRKGDYSQLESLGDVMEAIGQSESKNYLIFVFCGIILAIFVGGLVFGRVSKRVRSADKNK